MFQNVLTELRQFAGRLPSSVLIVGKVSSEQRAAMTPIFSLVTQGRFLDRLYYRLNVMTLNVNDDVAWPIPRAVTKKQFIGPAR